MKRSSTTTNKLSYNMGILEYDKCESSHNQHFILHHAYWFSSSSQEWIVDFGATKHMIRNEKIQHPLSNIEGSTLDRKWSLMITQIYQFQDAMLSPSSQPSLDISFMFQELDQILFLLHHMIKTMEYQMNGL